MKRTLVISAVLAALVTSLALAMVSAARPAADVGITLTDYKVDLSSSSIQTGVPVKFTATNHGEMVHEVVLEKAGAVDQALEIDGKGTEIDDIAPGQTKSATWTITQPGDYQLACHVPGHFEKGMVTRFTVTGPAGAGQAQVAAPLRAAVPDGGQPAQQQDPLVVQANQAAPADAPSTLPQTGAAASSLPPWGAAAAIVFVAAAGLLAWTFTHRSGRE